MEPQEPITQQPVQPPMSQSPQSKGKGTCVLVTILVAILFAAAAGGGVYYYMNQQAKTVKSDTDSQIQNLQNQISELGNVASMQTYTNETYGFSLEYPAGWGISEQTVSVGDAREYEVTFGDEGYSATVFNMGGQAAEEFIENFYGGVESGPTDIETVTIGSYTAVEFFMQKSSLSSDTIGSTCYLFDENETGVVICNSSMAKGVTDETLTEIVNSFEFLQ